MATFTGTDASESITPTSVSPTVFADPLGWLPGAGTDWLYGNGGNDTLDGGAGADEMYGGTGSDTYYIDNIDDNIYETSESSFHLDIVFSSVTYNSLDVLVLIGTDNINGYGNEFRNTLHGNSGNNYLNGWDGNDLLSGGAGDDALDGSWDSDELFGNEGNDYLVGGEGSDSLVGGDGLDELSGGSGDDTLSSTYLDGNDFMNFTSRDTLYQPALIFTHGPIPASRWT